MFDIIRKEILFDSLSDNVGTEKHCGEFGTVKKLLDLWFVMKK